MRYQRNGALRQLKIGNRWMSLWWTPRDFRFHSWRHNDGPGAVSDGRDG